MNITLKTSNGHIDLHDRISMLYSVAEGKPRIRIVFNGDTPNLLYQKDGPSFENLLFWLMFYDGKGENQIVDLKQFRDQKAVTFEALQEYENALNPVTSIQDV